MIDRLPSDVSIERLVLGAVLVDPEQLHGIRGALTDEDFSVEPTRIVWQAICRLYDVGAPVDRITVINALRDTGKIETAGGISGMVSLDDGLPEIVNLGAYVERLREYAIRRKIIRATDHIQQRCVVPGEPIDGLLDAIREGLSSLTFSQDSGPISTRQLIEKYGIDDLLAPRRTKGLRLPWPALDALLCGLQPDQMILVAAHTSYGKTSFALQVASCAAKQRQAVLIFSREMSARQLFRRMVNQIARVDYGLQRSGLIDHASRNREREAVEWLNSAPILFDEDAATVPAMLAAIRQVRSQYGLGLVVVDYLQLIRGVGRVESRAKEVGGNSRALKMAAKEFHIPFLVLSQFSRESAKEGRQPEAYDLKESGDIENDSDVVILIRPEDPKSDLDIRPVKVFVAKQREGPRNKEVPMLFFASNQRFEQEAVNEG